MQLSSIYTKLALLVECREGKIKLSLVELKQGDLMKVGNLKYVEKYVYGYDGDPELLDINGIINRNKAMDMLDKHINKSSTCLVHCDVDADGVICGKIIKNVIDLTKMKTSTYYTINAERLHGLTNDKVDKINKLSPGLVIIVDSSSNDIDLIKRINSDVIVVDHHEINVDVKMLDGVCNNGENEYVVVTNMVGENREGEQPKVDKNMSGAMVTYSLMRMYCNKYNILDNFDDLMLEQWVAISLYSDVIPIQNERNQYFVNRVVSASALEPTLKDIVKVLNIGSVNKHNINFKIVPLINSAIRAGKSEDVLNIILKQPKRIVELESFRKDQYEVIKDELTGEEVFDYYILKDITNSNIKQPYTGLVASKLMDKYNKSAFVYRVSGCGVCEGSFRGVSSLLDYMEEFNKAGAVGAGHRSAMGLKIDKGMVNEIMGKVCSMSVGSDYYLTLGKATGGIYHINNTDEFRRIRGLIELAIVNARSTGNEELNIVYEGNVGEPDIRGKVFIYDIAGLECIAFEPITSRVVTLYVEFDKDVVIYAKNSLI